MNRLAKYTLIIIATVLLIIGLCSCKPKPNNSGGTNNAEDNVVYSPNVEATLVLGEGVEEENLRLLKTTYLKRTEKAMKLASYESKENAHEIVIGKTSREVSEKAYRHLLTMDKEDEYVGYVIYSNGKSIAIAFDDAKYGVHAALTEALEIFVTNYMTSSTLTCKTGVLARGSFDAVEWQNERDNESVEILWNLKSEQLLSETEKNEALSEQVVKELKTLYELYNIDYKTVGWLANLYDPVTGGFYYSNSARNNEGYLPDLESTADAIGIVKAILTNYGGSLTDFFGEEIANRFISFAQDMQSAENGYFYHPQWPKAAVDGNSTRRSRDLMSALSILSDFDSIPKYDTPNGVKGESGRGSVVASSALVMPLSGRSVAEAVASVSSEDDIYIAPHLTSEKNFENYLSALNMEDRALDSLKTLNAQVPQILFRDEELEEQGERYRLSDIFVKWIKSKLNSETGLLGTDETINKNSLDIIYEAVLIHNRLGKEVYNSITFVNKIADFVVAEPDESLNINTLSSAWVALSVISENMHLFPNSFRLKVDLAEMYFKIPELLENTRIKLASLIKDDGSFMTQVSGADGMSHGMPIALSTADEGNVSATLVAIKNTWYAIFKTLNVSIVPIFMTADRMVFQKTLLDMGVIIKNEVIPIEPIDFEDYEVGLPMPDAKLTFSDATTATVETSDNDHGNVLNIKSINSSVNDTMDIKLLSSVEGATCNIAELDMCVLPGTENGAVFRVLLYNNMYLLSINVNGDTVMLHEDSYQYDASYKHDLGARAKVGEWFNVRIEYYGGTRDTVRAKIFFNGECIAVTNHFFNKQKDTAVPNLDYTYLRLETVKTKDLNILVDNVLTESNYRMYVPETNEKLARNVDAPEGKQTVHRFEETAVGNLPSGFVQTGGPSGAASVNGDKKLSISSGVTELVLPLDERGTLTNSAVVEFDATVSEDSAVGAYFTVSFNEYMLNDKNLVGFRLVVCEDSAGKYLTIKECLEGKEGSLYDDVRLPLGENFKFRAHLFLNERIAILMINNVIIGVNMNVSSNFPKSYMGELTLASSDAVATLLVDNLVCERIVADYKAAAEPSVDRETHEFDTLEGIESNGVSFVGEKVSFESAANNSYLKIPVNKRSGNGTFGVVFFDVQKTEVSANDLLISFTDKEGNKIASFALHATENSVDLYECTENGRYENSIYSIRSSEFTLGIEYSITTGDFNLLVNDKYVVSTSVTYSIQSWQQYRFEQLEISSNGRAGFIVDNAVVETSLNIFTTPVYKSENPDSSDEVVTYEHSSFANMTSLFNLGYLVTPEARVKVKESIVKGKVSRVLEYTSGTSAQDILLVKRWTKKLDGANAVAFESDIMMLAETKEMRLTLTLKPACTIFLWSKDGKMMINSDILKNKDTYLDIEDGEWFNIRFEYTDTPYDYDYDGKADVIVRVYVNGELVASGIKPDDPEDISSASSVKEVRLDVAGGSSGRVYLDNTKYEQFNMKYDLPLPPDTDTLTFEPGVISESVQATTKKGSSLSIEDITVEGEVRKVLKYISSSRASDQLDILVTRPLAGATAISFETDIMISPVSDKAQITLEPLNVNERQPFSLTLTAEKNGDVKLYASGIPEIVIGSSGEWIHLRIEYMNPVLDYDGDGDRDILVKVYVGESTAPKAIGYTPYSSTSHYNPLKIEKFRFSIGADIEAEIYLDNTKFWQINLAPDEGGKAPIEKEDEYFGDDGFDEDGWETK